MNSNMTRRAVLASTPLVIAGVSTSPAVAAPVDPLNRLHELAVEMTQIVRSLAPEGAGGVQMNVGANWNPHAEDKVWWHAAAPSYRLLPGKNGSRDMWVVDRTWHLCPESMRWC